MQKPKTLYVHRKLLNGADFIKWAKSQGFTKTLKPDDLHVTIAFSREAVDWDTIRRDVKPFSVINWDDVEDASKESNLLSINSKSDKRIVQPLGDQGAVVLKFSCDLLHDRWSDFIHKGCSWDYESYNPHITITYDCDEDMDLSKVQPYNGPLHFGPEVFETLNPNWDKEVEEVKP